jgi:hypothetical protein
MPHGGISPRGAIYEGASLGGVSAQSAAASGSLVPGLNTIANSTAVAAASFALPTPSAGLEVELFVSGYSTAGTDSLSVTAPTGVKINDGANTKDTISFGAAGQHCRLVAASASSYLVVNVSTGVSFST